MKSNLFNNAPVDKNELRIFYLTNLEADIIRELANILNIDNRLAMNIYYSSKLCDQINSGEYGSEYMGSKYLVHDLIENEPELIKHNVIDD
jgi:hypothetical protein